jgi:hypothetical protein
MIEECQRCKDIDEDRRTLEMACFYDMREMDVPLELDESRRIYKLRVCKDCRADWMKAIETWFNNIESPEFCGSGIYVRELGSLREISDEEFAKRSNRDNQT